VGTAWHTRTCFATTEPSVVRAAANLRADGADRIVVAPWFLAPGLLTDRLRTAGHPVAPALGAHPLLAEVALDRYDSAAASTTPGPGGPGGPGVCARVRTCCRRG
jgi:sirohydrochlorin ferrochelatase